MEEERKLEDVKTEEDFNNLSLDEQSMLELAVKANAAKRGLKTIITAAGKQWTLRPMSSKQAERISNIDYDIKFWQSLFHSPLSRRKAKRLNSKIRKAYARRAAARWLGRWWFVPGVAWFGWHYLYFQSEEVTATINTIGELGGEANFYSANLGCSKRQLVRSTMQVGNAYEDLQKRKKSADGMIAEDVSKTKEDNK